jgi:hypothetical protein
MLEGMDSAGPGFLRPGSPAAMFPNVLYVYPKQRVERNILRFLYSKYSSVDQLDSGDRYKS